VDGRQPAKHNTPARRDAAAAPRYAIAAILIFEHLFCATCGPTYHFKLTRYTEVLKKGRYSSQFFLKKAKYPELFLKKWAITAQWLELTWIWLKLKLAKKKELKKSNDLRTANGHPASLSQPTRPNNRPSSAVTI
jgi:hypothetical protein